MPRAAPYDREQALDAALALFWRKGFHATSLKDLEAELAMKPGSIYAAFHSKEALFRSVLDRYAERMRVELAGIAGQASPLGALSGYLRALGGLLEAGGPSRACMLVKTLLETNADHPEVMAAARRHLDAVEGDIAEIFAAAKRAGEIAPDADPARLARRVQSNIFGLKVQAQRETSGAALRMLAEDIAAEVEALRLRH
ncbi:TetR/AcrR family transcriptional regulator [Limimaricola pyoseonensis]|nr:TetR/AcrR family transcriptional regulator [Limimaricola pyoseonensis]